MRAQKRTRSRASGFLMARRGDDGFAILEATIAMTLLALLLVGLSHSLVVSLKAAGSGRQFQQATSLGNEGVENARDAGYDDLAMQEDDAKADPAVGTDLLFDPDGAGPLAEEAIVATSGGGTIYPNTETITVLPTTYTVKRYLTWVDADTQGGPGQDMKRLVVRVTWLSGSVPQSYETSAVITRARRGMPVPKLTASPAFQEQTVEPGVQVVFAHNIRNLGIVDAYDLSMPTPVGRSWTIQFYKDTDGDGVYDVGADTLLTDTNGNGTVDTDPVTNGEIFHFLAVWTLAVGEPAGTETLTLTIRSGADAGVSKTATDELTIGSAGTDLYLHNQPSPPTGNTNSTKNLAMNPTAPTATTLHRYSNNNYSGQGGRWIDKKSTSHSESDAKYMGNWVYQFAQSTTLTGDATLRISIAAKDFVCDKHPSITVYLREKATASTGTGTQFASVTASSPSTGSSPCGYRSIEVTIPGISRTFDANKWLELKITVNESTGDAALFAYDTTTYDSTLTIPTEVS